MRCPDYGGKKYRRNMDRRKRELERRTSCGGFGGFQAEVQLLRFKMRSEEIPVDYVRRAAALGDRRALALGLEPWPPSQATALEIELLERGCPLMVAVPRQMRSPGQYISYIENILKDLPKELVTSWEADAAERVLPIFENEFPGDIRPRRAIEAAKRWVEDPSEDNRSSAADAADAAWDAATAAAAVAHTSIAAGIDTSTAAADAAYATAEAAWDAAYASRPLELLRLPEVWSPSLSPLSATAAAYATNAAEGSHRWGGGDRASEQAWQKQRLIQYLLGEVQGPSGS